MLEFISFATWRLLALYTHFVLTTILLWTHREQIESTLKIDYKQSEYDEIHDAYIPMLAFALIGIVVKFISYSLTYNKVSLASALHLFLDVSGSFFVAWIAFDGMTWSDYIWIFVCCVFIPMCFDILNMIFYYQRDFWETWKHEQSFVRKIFEFFYWAFSLIWYFIARCCGAVGYYIRDFCRR